LKQPDPRLHSQQFCSATIAAKTTPLSGLFLPNFAIPCSVFTAVPGIADSAALALHSPAAFHAGLSTTDSFPIVWDTGASYSLSPHESNFGETLQSLDAPLQLNGLASGLAVTQKGVVNWIVQADDSSQKILTTEAYFAPGANVRLLSSQTYMQQHNGTDASGEVTATVTARQRGVTLQNCLFHSVDRTTYQSVLHSTKPPGPNTLPIFTSASLMSPIKTCRSLKRNFFGGISALVTSTLTPFSYCSGPAPLPAREPSSNTKLLALAPSQVCLLYGKQKRSRTPGSLSQQEKSDGNLKKDDLFPGQRVSVDHFICSTEGRLYDFRGKTSKEKMYCGGCLFVDHATKSLSLPMRR
jgi:hypothetical protein